MPDPTIPKVCTTFKEQELRESCARIASTCTKHFEEGGDEFQIAGPKKQSRLVKSARACAGEAQRATKRWGVLPEFMLKKKEGGGNAGSSWQAAALGEPSPSFAARCTSLEANEQETCRSIMSICEMSPHGPYPIMTTDGLYNPPTQARCINLAVTLPVIGVHFRPGEFKREPLGKPVVPSPEPPKKERESIRAQFVAAVNEVRRKARTCDKKSFAAAGPVAWNERLEKAAFNHSDDMARHGQLEHKGTDNSTAAIRALRAGYRWRNIGENIGERYASVQSVIDGWVGSPGHCANLMNPIFREIGGSVAASPKDGARYWTLVLGRR